MQMNHKKGLISLSPLIVFLAVYVVSSLMAGDFYKVPVSSAFLVACIFAVAISKGSIRDRVETFSRGAGKPYDNLVDTSREDWVRSEILRIRSSKSKESLLEKLK